MAAGFQFSDQTSAQQLMDVIDQASFALDEVLLFLDTHPCDQSALAYYQYVRDLRKYAVESYASQFGPLTKDQVNPGNYWS